MTPVQLLFIDNPSGLFSYLDGFVRFLMQNQCITPKKTAQAQVKFYQKFGGIRCIENMNDESYIYLASCT